MKYYAHSLEGRPKEEWQTLETHLKNVAELAWQFAESFDAGEWGYLAGFGAGKGDKWIFMLMETRVRS